MCNEQVPVALQAIEPSQRLGLNIEFLRSRVEDPQDRLHIALLRELTHEIECLLSDKSYPRRQTESQRSFPYFGDPGGPVFF